MARTFTGILGITVQLSSIMLSATNYLSAGSLPGKDEGPNKLHLSLKKNLAI